jgi:putative ABC transport system substrate-binding protein
MSAQRRALLAALAAVPFAVASMPARAQARQPPLRVYMILHRGETEVEKGFRSYFAERNIPLELTIRDAAQDMSRVPAFVAEARSLKPDLIYTWGTPVTLAVVGPHNAIDPARHVTDIPVVFTMVAAPRGAGLVNDGGLSGRNLTGASHVVPTARQLDALRAYRPLRSMAVLFNAGEPTSLRVVKELRDAAARERFELKEYPIPLDRLNKPQEAALPGLLAKVSQDGSQFLYLGPDSFIGAQRKVITESALVLRIPTFSATEVLLRDGRALFGLVSGYENIGRLTAYKVEQILLGKKRPQDVPIETLARFSYMVNMTVATEIDFLPPLKVFNFAEIIR